MIDYDYEARLIDRIAIREVAAKRLRPREKRILGRLTRYGETYREVGEREGISPARVRQIHKVALRRIRSPLAFWERKTLNLPASRTTADTPPPGFDRAAFLRHMEGLIAKREEQAREQRAREEDYARNWRKNERADLDQIMRNEERQGLFDPPPPPPPPRPQLSIRLPAQYNIHVYDSPSYTSPPLPTQVDLNVMAQRALDYLLLARPQQLMGTPWLGEWATSVVFTRDGGSVSEAVDRIVRELPPHARLSAFPVPVDQKVLGANATNPFASLRVTVTPDGLRLRFDVTWD